METIKGLLQIRMNAKNEDKTIVNNLLTELLCMVEGYLKSILVDVMLHVYRPCLIVAGLYSVALEIKKLQTVSNLGSADDYTKVKTILHNVSEVWERLV